MRLVPKAYPLFTETVERGIRAGYRRAFKHTDTPTEEHIVDTILEYVLNNIHESFDIDTEDLTERDADV